MRRNPLWAAALVVPLIGLGIVFLVRPRAPELAVYWPVPAFELLTQDSTLFRSQDLAGRVWIASFVYTNCPDVCPIVTRRLAAVRDSLVASGDLGERVRLFSISVDPDRDTPAVLREYARNFRAAAPDWVFLTGPAATVIPLINEGFKLTAINPRLHAEHEMTHEHGAAGSDYLVNHSDRLVLIDRQGQVRGTYPATEPASIRQLWKDVQQLAR